jgi:hypothetical protein
MEVVKQIMPVGSTWESRTITPRVFATLRTCKSGQQYEKISNLIKKYGCVVSKVSDFWQGELISVIYFDIPIDSKEQFLKEELELFMEQQGKESFSD